MSDLALAAFRADVTPPAGHPLCAGWTAPALAVDDPLSALGIVLLGDGDPVVLCAVDWCEISNGDHDLWRETLAQAAATTPERVAVQCVHQHNAPWPDSTAERLLAARGAPGLVMDAAWCAAALQRVADAVREAVQNQRPLTHLEIGQARVNRVASNRRVMGADGRVKAVRWTSCKDAKTRAAPEGLIDPFLKTISLWNGSRKLAALHFYAVHPCSYYGDGRVTADFVGQARARRQAEDGGALHVYFTGCAGNITPGKYNDGAPENRPVLTERLYQAMLAAERETERRPVRDYEWRVAPICFPPRADMIEADLLAVAADKTESDKERIRAALKVIYLRRQATPIPLTSLRLGEAVRLLDLPGEPFIEYQLLAQQLRPDEFVAVAGYGDCGTGYIPLARSFAEGGYEPVDAFVSPECEALIREAIARLTQPAA